MGCSVSNVTANWALGRAWLSALVSGLLLPTEAVIFLVDTSFLPQASVRQSLVLSVVGVIFGLSLGYSCTSDCALNFLLLLQVQTQL